MTMLLVLVIPASAALICIIKPRWAPLVTVGSSLASFALAIVLAVRVVGTGTLCAFGGALRLDALGELYLLLVAFVGLTAAIYQVGYLPARVNHASGSRSAATRIYYPLFNLFLGSMLAVSVVANLALIWFAIELTTIVSAFLVAHDARLPSLEAAWKYVTLTSMGAMAALLGILILYYGLHHQGFAANWPDLVLAAPRLSPAILLTGFVFCFVGFGAKAGLVPMHTWLPDAHSQAPAPVCALLSGVETSAALYVMLRLYPAVSSNPHIPHPGLWYIVAGLVSVAVAALLIIQVSDFKRLFAYSTIEHMGIILTACGLGTLEAHLGGLYQLMAHALTKSFCFYAAGTATLVLGSQKIGTGSPLATRSMAVAAVLMIGALAIAGLPPFAIFIGEFTILSAGFGSGQMLAASLLTLFIGLAFIAIVYQAGRIVFLGSDRSPAFAGPLSQSVNVSRWCWSAMAIAAAPMLVLGFYAPPGLKLLLRQAIRLLAPSP